MHKQTAVKCPIIKAVYHLFITLEVEWPPKSQEVLLKPEKTISKRILKKVGDAKKNLFQHLKLLLNDPRFRLRVGNYGVWLMLNRKKTKFKC